MSEVCMAVGLWHGRLCAVVQPSSAPVTPTLSDLTLDRSRVTCVACLVVLDCLEELGWPVKTRLQWWMSYRRKRDGTVRESLWGRGGKPSPELKRQAQRRGHRLERVRVLDVRSLKHWAATLRGEA